MVILGLTINEWVPIIGAAVGGIWAYFKIKSGQDAAKDDIISLKRTIDELKGLGFQRQEKYEQGVRELKAEFEKRLQSFEAELHIQANSHASTTATLSGMQLNLQALTSLVHGTNSRLDTLILRTKE